MIEVEERKRRRAILTYLNDAQRREASAELCVQACRSLGIPTYLDQATISLGWLKDQGLVELGGKEDFIIAKLTASGVQVALDERSVPGIDRPLI